MTTKVVYVLVSKPEDIYLEQALLSVYSLKHHTPGSHITILTDDVTEQTLQGARSKIKNIVDDMIVVEREYAFSAKESASSLKTTLRERMKGNFLFIDTDTIIVDDLSEIDQCPYDVAAVLDAHLKYENHFGYRGYQSLFKRLGVDLAMENYFNSGVMYVKDTEASYQLYQAWNRSYMDKRKQCFYDQPHLAIANKQFDIIKELDARWNCQVQYGIKYFHNAKIIHYFASNFVDGNMARPFKLMDKNVFLKIKECGSIPDEIAVFIEHSEMLWGDKVEIVGGKDVDLQHSLLMNVIRNLFYHHSKLYMTIERGLSSIASIKRSF